MASVKPFFLSIFLFFVQFIAFTFAAGATIIKANTLYPNPLERTAPIREIKNEKATRAFFSEKWKALDVEEDSMLAVTEYSRIRYEASSISKAQALLSVWKSYVAKSDGRSSSSQVMVAYASSNGDISQAVEAGWTVNVTDEHPRFYVKYWNTLFAQGCVNLDCHDLFQLAEGGSSILNAIIDPVSTYGGQPYHINVTINHETRNNNEVWAVYTQGTLVGYYPGSKLGELATSANRVDFGGRVIVKSNGPGSPHSGTEMGSGHFAEEDDKKAAYVSVMKLYDGSGRYISDASYYVEANNPKCYDVKLKHSTDPKWGVFMFYGGPGGKDTGCSNI